ncbi:MAG: hypothetical protein ACREFR_01980 [Limisphaerales bacterium]
MKRRLVGSLLACAVAFAVSGCKTFSHLTSSSSSSNEFKVVTSAGDGPDVQKTINDMTEQGWHFVSISSGGGDLKHYPVAILVFKRHK